MTERELFEAIGHVDDDLILAADAPAKKRRKPPVYWRNVVSVAACACVFLGGVAVWQSGKLHADTAVETAMESSAYDKSAAAASEDVPMMGAAAPQAELAEGAEAANEAGTADSAESSVALGLAQCVQIDGVRYFESPNAIDFTADREADGVITDSVSADAFPEADNCSNFGTGYSYWVTGENTVVVDIDGEYCAFEAN